MQRNRNDNVGLSYQPTGKTRQIGGTPSMVSESFRAIWSPRVLSILRIIVGLLFLEHGLSKYVGFPAPFPIPIHAMSLLGLAGVIEIASGVLVTIGLFTRAAAFIASGEMAFG